jgi:hypothetical protein
MKFRKKPVVIEAEQFLPGKHVDGVVEVYIADLNHTVICQSGQFVPKTPYSIGYGIETLEGWHTVSPGDWIITGIKGERYPCKPDIFAATYEPAGAPQ